jgi:SAM-dependent methyltransferase
VSGNGGGRRLARLGRETSLVPRRGRGRGAPAWPKRLPELSARQEAIRDDFMRFWLETLPDRYENWEQFNYRYALRSARPGIRTLEIGSGLGVQLGHENLDDQEYVATDLRQNLVDSIRRDYPQVTALVADAEVDLPFPDGHFDRILAIHCLEHMPNLPATLANVRRVLKPGGSFVACIPCEDGLMHRAGRSFSARPIFERRYKTSYDWFVETEHCNLPSEILDEVRRLFRITDTTYYPLGLPLVDLNVFIGFTATPRV